MAEMKVVTESGDEHLCLEIARRRTSLLGDCHVPMNKKYVVVG